MHIIHIDIGNLRDVNEPRLSLGELDKSAEIGDARYDALYYTANFDGQNNSSLQLQSDGVAPSFHDLLIIQV